MLFGDIADIQAALYRKIVRQRLEVIEKLREHVDANDLERVLQEHLYKNLWLLDSAWERAADHSVEGRVSTAFKAIAAQLTPEEAASRIDTRYKRTGGTNVIVELKRASVHTDALTLLRQIDKYLNALRKYLRDIQRPELIEVVCVLGRYPQAWTDREVCNQEVKMLAAKGARVVLHETLLADAESSYREYLGADTEAGRIATLVEGLAAHADDDELVSGEVSDMAPAGVR